jgi:hypothetical protein
MVEPGSVEAEQAFGMFGLPVVNVNEYLSQVGMNI